jgi:dolichyl-phosphate beta-glucosyltransferase
MRSIVKVHVTDTQCGFKMFRAAVSRKLFQLCEESGYIFDVEVLALAERLGMRIDEVGVDWDEVAGSKVRMFRDGFRMISDVVRVRRDIDRIARAA